MYCIAARIGPDNSQTSYCCLAQSVNVRVAPVRGEEGGLYILIYTYCNTPLRVPNTIRTLYALTIFQGLVELLVPMTTVYILSFHEILIGNSSKTRSESHISQISLPPVWIYGPQIHPKGAQ